MYGLRVVVRVQFDINVAAMAHASLSWRHGTHGAE
jgi:hypothetical protein